ncbi:MAG: septum formation protein Maf [Planctomycetes bacterium]|nr:septum formation protein Maf [Planctomycetota bacterium]
MVTFVGGLLLGTALGLPLYPLTFRAVVRHRSRKAAREEERSRRLREGLRLVLASSSPRRRELLAGRDYRFEVRPAGVREEVAPGLSPEEVARELARRKAEAVAPGAPPGSVVVGADTVVALGTEVLGKPADRAEARRMLTRLSGTSHRVITAVCLVEAPGGRPLVRHETTRVVMRPLGAEDVEAYVASGESDGKAGAYAIQETGDRFVRSVEGSYSNVVGLPMELLESMLSELGGGRHP